MAKQKQTEGITQEEQVFLDRVGIVLRGAKQIAAYVGVSPATIVRWRRRFRGSEEIRLCFPAFLVPTGRGYGLQLWSNSALIKEWMSRWSQIDCAEAQGKDRWKRRSPRMKREGETRKQSAGHFGEENERTVREGWQIGPTTPAPREELGVKVGEMPAASQASKEPCPCGVPSEGLPPTTQPNPALTRHPDCTCGEPTPCSVCQV
jgi:hypothetical protein